MCHKSFAPVYNRVQSMLVDDAAQVAQVLLDLEQQNVCYSPHSGHDSPNSLYFQDNRPVVRERSCPTPGSLPHHSAPSDVPPRPARKRRRPTTPLRHSHGHSRSLRTPSPHPLHIPNTHPSAPSILITPSPPQPRGYACISAPPTQDSCCGSRLTLPRVVHHPHRAKADTAVMAVDAERGRRKRGGVLLGRTVLGVGVGGGKKGRG